MQLFLVLLLSGLVSGALYALIASGLTLTYATTGIFNFSYGAVAYMCGYLFFLLNTGLHWNSFIAAGLVVLVFAPAIGLILEVIVFRPLASATDAAKIVATVGLLIALPALMRFVSDALIAIFNSNVQTSNDVAQVALPPGVGPFPSKMWTPVSGATITSDQIIIFVVAGAAALALWILVRRTTIGLQMRAVVDRRDLAELRGVHLASTSRVAWVVGMILASLAGVVAAPVIGAIQTAPFLTIMFIAAAAAVLGGLKSIPVAFAGGLLLGVLQNMSAAYLTLFQSIAGFSTAVPFIILLGALVLLGRDRRRLAGSVNDDAPPLDYMSHLPPWRRRLPWAIGVVLLFAYIFLVANNFWLSVMGSGLVLALIFLSFVVVTGMGGMVNLAQAAFVNAAGLTAGLLIFHYQLPFLIAMVGAVALTVLLGILVALPALRLGGLYLALATLALGFIFDNVLFGWRWFTNGVNGWAIEPPSLGVIDLADRRTMAVFLLVLVGITIGLIHNLQKSASGRKITAVRSSSVAAATSGISPVAAKMTIFAVSAVIAAVGGVMLATIQGNVTGTSKLTVDGLLWLSIVVVFGIRRPGAAVVAGLVSAVFPEVLRGGIHIGSFGWSGTNSVEIPAILFGLGAVSLARSPDGALADMAEKRYKRRLAKQASRLGTQTAESSALSSVVASHDAEVIHAIESDAASMLSTGVVADSSRDLRARNEKVDGTLLSISDLVAGYGKVEVLHGVSLSLKAGEIVGLFGANGSGKSTLVGAISGMVPATSGSIIFDGADIRLLSTYQRSRSSILIAPESRGVFSGLTVDENLTMVLPENSLRDIAYDRFPQLASRRGLAAGNLSGGEQQMLTLAPFIARPPRVLIADEPTLGLAPLVVEQVMSIFGELRELGVAILLVEEKTTAVLPVADWVAVFELGHIVWQGPAASTDSTRLASAYLGHEGSADVTNRNKESGV